MMEKDLSATDTLNERGKWIRIGWLVMYARPLVLSQVIEIGEMASYMQEYDTDEEKQNIADFTFRNSYDVETLQEVAIIALFRSKMMRKMFGWYVRKRMNTKTLKKCFSIIYDTFDYAFFFKSSIFLSGIKMKKKETENREEAVRGGSWVES